MRPFLARVFLFFALNGAIFAGLMRWYPTMSANGFYAAIIDKEALLRTTPPPRILLTGGSNVAFGFDSAAIARATGRPTLNLSITAEVGRQFILNHAAANTRAGDTVVLALEYYLFAARDNGRGYALSGILESQPRALRYFGLREEKNVLDDGLVYLGGMIRSSLENLRGITRVTGPETAYRRNGFNALGDMTAHHSLTPEPALVARELLTPLQLELSPDDIRTTVAELTHFVSVCRAHGATVCFQLPPIPQDSFDRNRETIARIHAAVRQIPGLVMLNDPTQVPYPKELFFDTVFHLRKDGCERRTQELIGALTKINP